jgi:hypothetical protein
MSDELETWDWERREEEDRRQVENFRRIHQLYKRGFGPDWTITDVEDAIWWRHPGGHPDLILYADGKLVEMERFVLNPNEKPYEKRDGERIYNDSKARRANAALYHAPLAFDQLEHAEPEQIAHMIDAAARAVLRDFLVFGENGWQLELLEMMPEQQLRFIGGLGHAASWPSKAL